MAYKALWTIKSRQPDHTSILALTATCEPGRQLNNIIHSIGLRSGSFHLEKRDCERKNVSVTFRTIKYPFSGYKFRDLDWLVSSLVLKASDLPKRLLFSATIEMGHRITLYLRSLLPPHLQPIAHILIRHIHSMNCPDCKAEGMAELFKSGDERTCAIIVTTAVLEVGVNIPELYGVVIYPEPRSLSSLLQSLGRPARERGSHGEGIVYVKKKTVFEAQKYINANPNDPRLLSDDTRPHPLPNPVLDVNGDSEGEEIFDKGSGDMEDVNLPETAAPSDLVSSQSPPRAREKGKGKPKTRTLNAVKGSPSSLSLVVAAHAHQLCIVRQINTIYGNPGILHNCGRCSSCTPTLSPEPQPAVNTMAPATDNASSSPPDEQPEADTTPSHLRLLSRDVEQIAKQLESAAYGIRRQHRHPDDILLSARCFLLPSNIKAITKDFHLVTSKDVLKERMGDWHYWETSGDALWETVERLGREMRSQLETRHEESLAKRREAAREKREADQVKKTRGILEEAGLAQVKVVRLLVTAPAPVPPPLPCHDSHRTPPSSPSSIPLPVEPCSNAPSSPVPPLLFYAKLPKKRQASNSPGLTRPSKARRTTASQTVSILLSL